MQRFKKLFWIGLAGVIAVTIIRDNGFFQLNYYSADTQSNRNSNLADANPSFSKPLESDPAWREKVSDPCQVGFEMRDAAVKVYYDGFARGDSSDCGYVRATINKLEMGNLWMPLYKSANFEAIANVDGSFSINKAQDGQLVTTHYTITGTVTVTGNVTIKGICSNWSAKKIVLNHVMEQVYKETKSHLKK